VALDAKILIVDDDPSAVEELENILAAEAVGDVSSTTEPKETLYFCGRLRPDLVLLDLGLGTPTSREILRDLLEGEKDFPVPRVVGLVEEGQSSRELGEARDLGVRELLRKPFEPVEVALRVRALLERDRLREDLRTADQRGQADLDDELARAKLGVLHVLARLVEYRDFKTEQHAERVGELSARIARELGLPDDEVALLRDAAPLHDLGMVVVPDRILLKSGQLDEDERRIMMTHAANGARILSGSDLPVIELARQIAHTHHERWDGAGYPRGLEGEEIPLVGRIVAVADAFEAITHDRPFREAESAEGAMAELRRERGRQFDPRVVDAALEVVEREEAPRA